MERYSAEGVKRRKGSIIELESARKMSRSINGDGDSRRGRSGGARRGISEQERREQAKRAEMARRMDESRRGSARRKGPSRRRRKSSGGIGILVALIAIVVVCSGFGFVHYKNQKEEHRIARAGVEYLNQGNYEAAVETLNQAVQKAGKRMGAYEKQVLGARAEAEYRVGDYDTALETYQTLRKADAENETYKKGVVLCLMEKKEYSSALERGVLQAQIYSQMATDQIEAKDYNGALTSVQQGQAVVGDDQRTARELAYDEAVLWEYAGDYGKALELFEDYEKTYGTDDEVSREITFLRSRQGNN